MLLVKFMVYFVEQMNTNDVDLKSSHQVKIIML